MQLTDETRRRDSLLFYHPECQDLAERIVEAGSGNVLLGRIQWR